MIDVLIVGAGPTGLMLACELALAGVRPVVLDPTPGPNPQPRAAGVTGQGPRLLDHRGFCEKLSGTSDRLRPIAQFSFGALPVNFSEVADSRMYMLAAPQAELAQELAREAVGRGIDLRWGHRLADFAQHNDLVTALVEGPDGPYELTTRYLVGADGGHSLTRKLAGIDFPGMSSQDVVTRLGFGVLPPEDRADDVPGPLPFRRGARGLFFWGQPPGKQPVLGSLELDPTARDERAAEDDLEPMTLTELQESLERVTCAPFPVRVAGSEKDVHFRRFIGINSRIASQYRAGNVFLVGDAAHVHFTMGGPGLNLGLQDAVNLGWKLAQVARGHVEPALLDTYEAERKPMARRVLTSTRAQLALIRPGSEMTALREIFGELLADSQTASRISDLLSGADVRYPVPEGAHELAGWWAPDLTIETQAGPRRLAELARDGKPVFLDFTGDGISEFRSQLDEGVAVVIGSPIERVAANRMLIRPDGIVAWAGTAERPDHDGLQHALRHWFGIDLTAARTNPSRDKRCGSNWETRN
ncbi:FAD-dependent monooxygenase [Mycobacterium arosiense]|uniref:Polyketide oxidase n=1 Tax=Mycobacterium arosiense ATCC BAA-1401 = DSM 45069 TaxID=1265311 RepID=A0A1W9Z9A3_MYCAI|nr:FAD-dependent monooxygenase [Mycobacterium arosiense]ORA09802.1 polyketide oxidase [Mycobacterium arosiense ATCC BAA-1401 = DSM 45069]